jgi:type VI secretion system protein ImpA
MINVDSLLKPLEGPAPCGPDLEYAPVSLQIEAAIRGGSERPIGVSTPSVDETDWQAVRTLSHSLLLRSKDLRVAIYLVRAELRLEGPRALASGLRLIGDLLSRYGDCIHPMPDEDDPEDMTARLSTLNALGDPFTVIADLRQMHFGDPTSGVTGRGIELSSQGRSATDEASVPTLDEVNLALQQEERRDPGLLGRLVHAEDAVSSIEDWAHNFDYSSGFDDFYRLRSFLSQLRFAASLALPEANEAPQASVPAAVTAATDPSEPAAELSASCSAPSRFAATLQTERLDPLDIKSLLTPVDANAACGPNLEYDPQFLALENAACGGFGVSVLPSEERDWAAVRAKAQALFGQTKDLRIAVYLLRALTRLGGLESAVDGLRLIEALLERYWDDVHPTLDPDDDGDPTFRMNILYALADSSEYLDDLRSLGFGQPAIAGRAIERLAGDEETAAQEPTLTADVITEALTAELERVPIILQHLHDAAQATESIEAIFAERLGDQTIDLDPLIRLFRRLAGNIEFVLGLRDDRTVERPQETLSREALEVSVEEIDVSLDDAVQALGQIQDWLEQASFDVSRQCRRAKRLTDPQFRDIARALVPDRVEQIEDFFRTDDK